MIRTLEAEAGFAELVVHCAGCGVPSSNDLEGRSRWRMVTVSALRVVDYCPDCAPGLRARRSSSYNT